MKRFYFLAALFISAGAAQAASPVKRHTMLYSADDTKIGRVETIVEGTGGPSAVRVIYRGKFVTIPASSLTDDAKGLKTSLSTADLKKM
jgi:hypothetical protein